ncbi:MAG TPA: response regulator [Ignavibacteriales bacterium]|nr:response regulator [Ignavibacteriales bacterium]
MEVLLIEDNPGDILLIQTVFEQIDDFKVNFTSITNGMEASLYLIHTEETPDLIILDLNLPQKNGFELLKEIKSNRKYSEVPVVVFTSSNNSADKKTVMDLGADAYISKSIDLDEYKNHVLYFLSLVK